MTIHAEAEVSVLRDLLGVYDARFLELPGPQRSRLVAGTREALGDGLGEEARAALPSAYRMRAFCIQHGLEEELERLVRDEVEGLQEGAVVVGGRVYAVYPYLRGVPRHYADVTDEIEVVHRLDAVDWRAGALRLRGSAMLERIHAREETVELVLRERLSRAECTIPTCAADAGFEARIDPAGLAPGGWDVHVAAGALGLRREARLGAVRGPRLRAAPVAGTAGERAVTAAFTKQGHLALAVTAGRRPGALWRLLRAGR